MVYPARQFLLLVLRVEIMPSLKYQGRYFKFTIPHLFLIHPLSDYFYPSHNSACVCFTNGPHEDNQSTNGMAKTYHVAESRLTWKVQGTHGCHQRCAYSLHERGGYNIKKTWPVCFLPLLILILTLLGLHDGSATSCTSAGALERNLIALTLGMLLFTSGWMILMKVHSSYWVH